MAVTGLSTYFAMEVWDALDARLAEAKADTIGLEEALTWEKAIKTSTLMILLGSIIITAGFSGADVADELISWFDEYSNDTSKEGSKKTNGDVDPDGTSAMEDIPQNIMIASMFLALGMVMTGGAYWFAYNFVNLGADNFVCDVEGQDPAAYAGVQDIIKKITN